MLVRCEVNQHAGARDWSVVPGVDPDVASEHCRHFDSLIFCVGGRPEPQCVCPSDAGRFLEGDRTDKALIISWLIE